jgi:hypothetical protein
MHKARIGSVVFLSTAFVTQSPNLQHALAVFKRPLPDEHNATWRAVLRGVDWAVPQPTRVGVEDCVTVAQGLTPGHHVLELRGADLAKEVLAARFYSPERVRN